ncbi:hypothetical protein [Hymenobacter sp. BT491]|uniref:hypothetical protein n=1 Tax=Hymenobacter sp. BT491 TaxID=2766779 RepID=UPI00165392F2|nr:hypothetical protein [Hymenobacter sp. BT491]MBC6988415.1 hypothetical protein [Hymenobacter sp. BT491]
MDKRLRYQVRCQVTLAQLDCGQVVGLHQEEHHVTSDTAELNELFVDLCDHFRSPRLLGLQILSIRRQRRMLRRIRPLPSALMVVR